MTRDRRKAERAGRWSEQIAALWLQAKGYRIIERRMRAPFGEIDLIASRGGVVAFIEVKARTRREAALHAVTPAAARRIEQAAAWWMARRPEYSEQGWRYDVVAIAPGRPPMHVRDAWRPDFAA